MKHVSDQERAAFRSLGAGRGHEACFRYEERMSDTIETLLVALEQGHHECNSCLLKDLASNIRKGEDQ